jgi:signal-transduction protein with cAMP-binding, CBS, and nucleotidyltransferase domain
MSIQAILYRKGRTTETIAPGASVNSAAEKLRDSNVTALVVESQGTVLGLLSEREIVHALAAQGQRTCELTVAEVMAREVVTIAAADSLNRAMSLMTRHRTRHLLVLRDGAIAGIVSLADIIKHRLDDLELAVHPRSEVHAAAH